MKYCKAHLDTWKMRYINIYFIIIIKSRITILFEFHSSRKITSLKRNKEDSILTLFTLEVLERPPINVYVSFGSYSFMS